MRAGWWKALLPVLLVIGVTTIAAAWRWEWIGANSSQLQAIAAAAGLAVTVAILLVYRGQERIMANQEEVMRKQAGISAQQGEIQRLLAWLEHAPIMCAEFGTGYEATANQITLKNTGRGAAHNIRGQVWVVAGFSTSEIGVLDCSATPAHLGPGDPGSVSAELQELAPLRAAGAGVPPRLSDRWVLHFGDVLGGTWHTTSNIDDGGQYAPLGYFRSWSPSDWAQLPEETRKLCQVCAAGMHS
jgi:hypothetical protein